MNKIILSILVVLTSISTLAKDTPLLTGDVGGSTGTNNGTTYTEMHAAVNLNFTDWLTWRNSGYQRTGNKIDTTTGLDTSLRLNARTKAGSDGSAYLFIGPGYRWASKSDYNAAFAEAGLGFSAGPAGLSAGAKYLKYDKTRTNTAGEELKDTEMTYFLSITGNMSFGK